MSTIVVRVNSSDTISATISSPSSVGVSVVSSQAITSTIQPAVSFTGTVGLTPAEPAVTYSADGTTLQLVGTTFSAVTQAPTNGGTGLTTADQVFDYVASNPGNFVTDADVTNHGIGDFSDVNDGTKAAATGDLLVWNNVASEFQRGGLSAGEGVTFVKAGNDIQINAPLSDDTSPSLGGDLDVNGNKITSASNGDITIDPDGTGAIILKSDDIQFDGGGTFQGKIKLYESDVLGSNFVALSAPLSVTSDITFTLPDGYGTNGQALTTNGAGTLSWGTVLDGNSDTLNGVTSFRPQGATSAQLAIYDNDESNYVILRAPANLTSNTIYYLPALDGSSGQVLKTNGSGSMSWTSVGTVDTSGTPSGAQLAVFTDANTIEGDTNLQWSGTKLIVAGELDADRINSSAKTALSSAGNYAVGSEILGTVYSSSSLTGEAGKVHYLGSATSVAANASTEASGSGMLVVVTDAENRAELLTKGVVRVSTTLTSASIGDKVYLNTTAGTVTTTAPTGSGNVVRIVGHVVKPSANMIYFNPSSDWIVVA